MTKDEVLEFVKSKKLAVISTCGFNGLPEAALIGFGETEDFELIFGTSNNSRKYKNLQENNSVAFVIGFGEESATVQYEGQAIELDGAELDENLDIYHKKSPGAAKFRSDADQSYWRVQPLWLRFSDFRSGEQIVFEYEF